MPSPPEALVQFPCTHTHKKKPHAHKLLYYYIIYNITQDKALVGGSVKYLPLKGGDLNLDPQNSREKVPMLVNPKCARLVEKTRDSLQLLTS